MPPRTRHVRLPPAPPREPAYADYLYDLYRQHLLAGQAPVTTTDLFALEDQARRVMTASDDATASSRAAAFDYIAGGAGAGSTVAANRRALDRWVLVPRMVWPADHRDLRVRLFGDIYSSPVIMAPVGVQGAYHADRELGTAAACAELDVPFTISTASTSTIEEIAAAVGEVRGHSTSEPHAHSPDLWFQLYWPRDDAITASLLARARAAGCRVLVVTVDTFALGWRPADLDAGYLPFAAGEGNAIGFSDENTPENNVLAASMRWTSEAFPRRARPWADLAGLRHLWGGPLLVKGVLHPEDARRARQHGADGIVVSNHGGRQVDGAVGALEMLPDIVAAVRNSDCANGSEADAPDGDFTIVFDSGIRSGADVIKALCLGAQAVLVGRPVVYGLGIAGRDGARHVLASLLADLDQTMSLIGAASVADLGPHMIRDVAHAKASL